MTVNLPSADLICDDLLLLDSIDFGVINGKSGLEYDLEDMLYLGSYELGGVAPGGTATGWIGAIVDKTDDSPMMYYRSLDDKMPYFKLNKAYDIPDDDSSYQPIPTFLENPIRDDQQKKGCWKNPYEMGETVNVNYAPKWDAELASPFSADICVADVYRGESAEQFVDLICYTPEPGMELIVLKIAVNVIEAEGNDAPSFEADHFTLLTGQGGEVSAGIIHAFTLKADGLKRFIREAKQRGTWPFGFRRVSKIYCLHMARLIMDLPRTRGLPWDFRLLLLKTDAFHRRTLMAGISVY